MVWLTQPVVFGWIVLPPVAHGTTLAVWHGSSFMSVVPCLVTYLRLNWALPPMARWAVSL